jgi:hypothetical protein
MLFGYPGEEYPHFKVDPFKQYKWGKNNKDKLEGEISIKVKPLFIDDTSDEFRVYSSEKNRGFYLQLEMSTGYGRNHK